MTSKPTQSALATAASLLGGMLIGFAAGSAVHGLPFDLPDQTRVALASLPALAGILGGGSLWGFLLARIHAAPAPGRMAAAGAISFGPAMLVTAILLSTLEVAIVERGGGPDLPVHVVFSLLFVPASFLVTGIGSSAMGAAAAGGRPSLRVVWMCGLAGAGAFLGVDLLMDLLGWRVGAPGAAARATMLTVMFLGSLAAALAGGAALGVQLASARRSASPPSSGG